MEKNAYTKADIIQLIITKRYNEGKTKKKKSKLYKNEEIKKCCMNKKEQNREDIIKTKGN